MSQDNENKNLDENSEETQDSCDAESSADNEILAENDENIADLDDESQQNAEVLDPKALLYAELTDYIQKQMDLIKSMKTQDFAKISQNIDIVDAIKIERQFPPKITKTAIPKSELTTEEFFQKINESKNLVNYEVRNFCLSNKEINQQVHFYNCDFKNLDFKSSVFRENVTFTKCSFKRLDFNKAKFDKNLTFESCEFLSSTIKGFEVANFLKIVRCRALNRFLLNKVKVKNADFWGTKFNEWFEINNCTFTEKADLRSIDVDGGIEIVKCKFENDWIMRGANVQRPVYVRDSTIKGCFDFQRAKFRDFVYFDELKFLEGSSIALWNVVSHGIFINPEQLEDRLCSQRHQDFKTAAAEYGAMKANYQFLNRLDDEDWAYFRFKRMNRLANKKECKKFTKKAGNFFEWLFFEFGSKYGTKPLRVLGLSAIFILFFALIYLFPAASNYNKAFTEDSFEYLATYKITGEALFDVPLSAILISAGAFVSGFDAVDKNVEGWVSIFLTLEALTGMLFLGLFIVSFSRKVIR